MWMGGGGACAIVVDTPVRSLCCSMTVWLLCIHICSDHGLPNYPSLYSVLAPSGSP